MKIAAERVAASGNPFFFMGIPQGNY